jgi:hypothetical protein
LNATKIPGKLFLIGEYGVIDGGTAIIAATRPGFQVSPSVKFQLHPESPAGVYLREFSPQETSLQVPDLEGRMEGSGFGTSTAELISTFQIIHGRHPDGKELWSWFKARFPNMSGADLATQIEGMSSGESLFEVGPGLKLRALSKRNPLLNHIQVFKIPPALKMKTHEDLDLKRQGIQVEVLNRIVQRFATALQDRNLEGLSALTEFAEALSNMGRESRDSNRVRQEMGAIPGVVGVKGCGASLHDVFLVACRDSDETLQRVKTMGRNLGLTSLGSLGELLW